MFVNAVKMCMHPLKPLSAAFSALPGNTILLIFRMLILCSTHGAVYTPCILLINMLYNFHICDKHTQTQTDTNKAIDF